MNRDNEIFTIHIIINGVKMPLTIPRGDEEIYRNAEKLVNKYLEKYSTNYSQISMEQILTYVSYQFAVIVSKQSMYNSTDPLVEKIEVLNKEIKELLEV